MKHVREELPDVQVRRPEVSAALAAVIDRATCKELDRRYPDAAAMIADLEDVLAIETSRSGQVTGEATAVLRSLPESTRKRLPLRTRRSTKALVALVAVGALAALAVALGLGLNQTERGTGKRADVTPPAGLQEIGLGQRAAHDFDPLGDDHEHPDQTSFVVDDDPASTWSTEGYSTNDLQKAGVGLVIDTSPGGGTAARELELRTPTPGFTVEVYVAQDIPKDLESGWQLVGGPVVAAARTPINLDVARQRYRHYLVWITKLPPGEQSVQISEILMFK
ncbi:MAG: eukaryotic-like serine/threonine-protein kinase [bacterium]